LRAGLREVAGEIWIEMDADLFTTTCPVRAEFERAVSALQDMGNAYWRIDPTPALARVAVPALVMGREVRASLHSEGPRIVLSGWVEHRPAAIFMPDGPAPEDDGLCFRRAAIMVLSPCVADETKIRLVAHVEGDLAPALPFLNAVMPHASYMPRAETLTYMDGHRMVALYGRRITIAQADEIVDAWVTLERIRRQVEDTWARRESIEPAFETRKRPPALEIYKRLPETNCGLCGELTCMAFALRLWSGQVLAHACAPAFEPGNDALSALLEIVAGMGLKGVEKPCNGVRD
jgi:ArsR family metal-binding transcriptional regulator